jgi:DNA polymerase (family X)
MSAESIGNAEVAAVLQEIGDILEIQGENRFRVLGYRRAAENILALGRDIRELWQAGELESIPGVGEALSQKIDELLRTGRLGYLDDLHKQVPPGVVGLTSIPDVGPSKARVMWEKLDITSITGAEEAARAGKLRDLPGFGAKTEAKILSGIEALRRRQQTGRTPIGDALPVARALLSQLLAAAPGIQRAEIAGSLRRRRDTIGDMDLLVATDDPEPVMAVFRSLPQVGQVLGSGPTKTSVRLHNGMQVDLRALEPARWGTALQYFTGSQAHNVELRELALKQGWSLNEYALTPVAKAGEASSSEVESPATEPAKASRRPGKRAATGEKLCAHEAEVYEALGLPWIPPELREAHGEIRAAQQGKLPKLVTLADIKGDLHNHSTYSDGKNTLAEMAAAAQARGYRYFAFTDHSQSLGVTGGMTAETWQRQREELAKVREQFPDLTILQGAEVEVRADGSLDYPDEVLAQMDVVIAAVHVSHRQPRDQITGRALNALRNPHVDILAHPSGRLMGRRDPSEVDLEQVIQVAKETGVILEINAHPMRLDLDDLHARRAVELGVPLVINTDAHSPADMDYLEYGVAVAARAWATADSIANAWPTEVLLGYLRRRGKG